MMNERNLICNMVIVGSGHTSEIDHSMRMMTQKRSGMKKHHDKRAFYTDTWPNSNKFWERHLGSNTEGKLGLFHYQKRISDKLDPQHVTFHQIRDKLSQCIYRYNNDDMTALRNALLAGTISGKIHTEEDIKNLRNSRLWTRYNKYLRKQIHSGDEIRQRLDAFVVDLKPRVEKDPTILITTMRALNRQVDLNKGKAHHIQDPIGIKMYVRVSPGKLSKHKVPVQLSRRPESKLESFHGTLAHFANLGMRADLAMLLTMRGSTEYNQKQEKKLERILDGYDDDTGAKYMRGYLLDQPKFYNHAFLEYLNQVATERGITSPFLDCKKLPSNNGERFLSDYFHDQQIRNQHKLSEGGTCVCIECKSIETSAASAATLKLPPPQIHKPPPLLDQQNQNSASVATVKPQPPQRPKPTPQATEPSQAFKPLPATTIQRIPNKPQICCLPTTAVQMYLPPLWTNALQVPPQLPNASQFWCVPLTNARQIPPQSQGNVCCSKYREYLQYRQTYGKCRPGPVPHQSSCRTKKAKNKPGWI